MKHIYTYSKFNESITFGKLLGNISKGLNKIKRMIGFTGEDEDLADDILSFLDKKLSGAKYVNNTNFDKEMIQRPIPGQFVFYGKDIFPNQNEKEFRVDVIKASDPSIGLHKDPYRVYISVVTKDSVASLGTGYNKTSSGHTKTKRRSDNHELLITANPKMDEKMEQLNCSTQAAEMIWRKCEEIQKISTPTTKGNARGGSNEPQKRKGNIFKKMGISW